MQHHPFKQIKIKCKTINDRTGHFAYQTKTFEIIPGHTLNDNERLIIDTNTWKVYIEKDAKELTSLHLKVLQCGENTTSQNLWNLVILSAGLYFYIYVKQ